MYKNRLQEVAQRSCFNLPSYACIREGPDHAPRFKATVNFNGELFESPTFCGTLRQAEHAAAEVALNVLSNKSPSKGLAARVMDETGVYKTLLQETAHRAGLKLPVYVTVRSGPGHVPSFSCTVELAGMNFTGDPAKSKKQAQKNAAMAAWSALKRLSHSGSSSSSSSTLSECSGNDEQEQVSIAHYLSSILPPMTKKFTQRAQRREHASNSLWGNMIPHGGSRALCTTQWQKWALPQSSPGAFMDQCWLQERLSQQHSHLVELSSLPTCPPIPQIFPLYQSIFPPDHGQYFLPREPVSFVQGIGPSFIYISNHSVAVPVPITTNPQVTIQEIEEIPSVEGEWPRANPDSDCWKMNFSSNVSKVPVSLTSRSEQKLQEVVEAKDVPIPETRNATQFRGMDAEFTSRPTFRAENPPITDLLGSPVTVRTANAVSSGSLRPEGGPNSHMRPSPRVEVSACSAQPWFAARKNIGSKPSANQMAPPVHIRSVVPVCSAPARKFPGSSSQEAHFSEHKNKTTDEQKPKILAATSESDKP